MAERQGPGGAGGGIGTGGVGTSASSGISSIGGSIGLEITDIDVLPPDTSGLPGGFRTAPHGGHPGSGTGESGIGTIPFGYGYDPGGGGGGGPCLYCGNIPPPI